MFFLTGEYSHQLDAKNRIRIPAKLKKELGDRYCFTKGTNGCLFVFPEEVIKDKIAEIEEIKMSDADKQKGVRAFLKSVNFAEEDNQGRVILPSKLKEFANIQKDVVICGSGSHIEIWAKEVYDKYFEDENENYDGYFNSLGI